MSIDTTPETVSAPAKDWLFLGISLGLALILMMLTWLEAAPFSMALVGTGFLLGAAFTRFEFSFTAAFRRFVLTGDASLLLAGLALIALSSVVIIPVAALYPGYGVAQAPIGPSLVIGAFAFGIGMQLANGCGSGTLYAAGSGSGRMLIALAGFMAGSVLGSMHLPWFLTLGGFDPIVASKFLGPIGGLAITLVAIAGLAGLLMLVARKRGAASRPTRTMLIAAAMIGLLCIAAFLFAGHPWSVTFGITLWGAKIAKAIGLQPFFGEFWQWPGPKNALGESLLADTSSLVDFGVILGAMAWAAFSGPFALRAWPPLPSLIAALLGGLIMGWGARLGFGCNIGAFVGGIGSGSVHGFIWFACALVGSIVGVRLRPVFGLSNG